MRSASWMLVFFWLTCVAISDGRAGADEIADENGLRVAQAGDGSPKRRVAARTRGPSGFVARWVGQDGQDWTGLGPSVGPDGLQDVHIALSKLAVGVAVKAIRIEGSGQARWEFGMNPRLFSNAELIRDAKGPSDGELYFQPDRDLKGERLKVILAYGNDKFDTATLVAGPCDAGRRVPLDPLPELNESTLKLNWLGQDASNPGSPGDVRIAVSGVPASASIVGGVLTDAVWGTWIFRGNDRASIPDDPVALPLVITPRSDGTSADVFFVPYRDESKETMTLRLITANGQNLVAHCAGGGSDLSLLDARPEPSRIEARPGDDLQALVDKYGTVALAPGTFRLARPLVLNRPVTVTSEGGTTLLFDQSVIDRPWSSAIKIHRSNTTLNGFAVRFVGPIRWNNEISWGPAVIGMTDNLDPHYNEPKRNLTFTRLDLEIPPVRTTGGWVEAVRLMRLIGAKNGVIAGNVLFGGPIEFFDGPWRIVDNDSRGTVAGTFSHGVFGAHRPCDVLVRGNRARELGEGGKTWRFLVLSGPGYGDVIERNLIDGIGSREGDTIPWSNEPEIILTESYKLSYEGSLMSISGDGRLIRTGRPFAAPGRTGDVVSLLDGPAAGEWRRIVQAIDSSTFLVDRPIVPGTKVVSIAAGFVAETFQDNRIDIRGGEKSTGLVLVGNHFGTRVVRNHVLGGRSVFKLAACPTEAPMIWGWTHAPFLGGLIEGNIVEDCARGASLGVEHDSRYVKSNKGRTYMTARVSNNVVRWSEPFLRRVAAERTELAGLTIGFPASHDPGELVVRASGNRLEAPAVYDRVPTLVVRSANFNSQPLVHGRYRLPQAESPRPDVKREARARSPQNAR